MKDFIQEFRERAKEYVDKYKNNPQPLKGGMVNRAKTLQSNLSQRQENMKKLESDLVPLVNDMIQTHKLDEQQRELLKQEAFEVIKDAFNS